VEDVHKLHDHNKACPKYAYPLPNIDHQVDRVAGHCILSFLDAYSGYNKIQRLPRDKVKTTFMTNSDNFYYEVISFGLKNPGAIYQIQMDQIFKGILSRNVEVYIDDIVVKSDSCL